MRFRLAHLVRVAAVLPWLGIAAACVASGAAGDARGPHEAGRAAASGSAAAGASGAPSGGPAPDGAGSVYLPGEAPPPAGHAFDPPPLGPQKAPPPVPPRPADKVPSAEEQARKIADCARFNDNCNDCAEAHKCGYCPDNGKCTPGDLFGPYPGTCSGAWSPMQCIQGPKEAEKHDAETRKEMAKRLTGFTVSGGPVDHPMKDAKTPVQFQVKRGQCYQVSLRLSGDVDERWDLRPTVIPHVTYYEGGNGVGAGFDGFVFDAMCPQQDGTIDVYLTTYRAQTGTYRAQLWSAPIAEDKLVRMKEEHDTEDRRAKIGAWCKSCIEEWARCRVAAEPHCVFEYYHCLAAAHLTAADCERGDIAPPPPEPDGPKNEARLEGTGAF
ncbi:MAG: hypothetical protein U0441_16050 [Polyangiaceae bacterium]